jgi:AraC-like DNA-binding protein
MAYTGNPMRQDCVAYAPEFVPHLRFRGLASNESIQLHAQIDRLWHLGDHRSQLRCRGLLLDLLVQLIVPLQESVITSRPIMKRMQEVRESLSDFADRPLDEMPSLMKHLSSFDYSYRHLCRLFRKTYGLTPLAYVHHLRIERAKFLLRESRLSVAEVGRSVGIENATYFSRLFRKIVGLRPVDYRQSEMS